MAQSIADMMVEIGADISEFERKTKEVNKDMKSMGTNVSTIAKEMGHNVSGFSEKWGLMSQEMKDAYKASRATLKPFKRDLMDVEYQYFKMAQGMSTYKGSTKNFMDEVAAMGKKHKTATENIMKNNDMMKRSFIQTVGTMLNRSTQSEKIAKNFERMGNPLYSVNNGLLNVTNSLNQVAIRGSAAVLALKMLGPNANMKELNDMTMMINQGLMRFQVVALAAAVASGILYTALFKAAKGPDPSEVYRKQSELLQNYAKTVKEKTKEIMDTWNIFENIELKAPKSGDLIANLDEQVNALKTWRTNLDTILSRTGNEDFTKYLADLGPQAAGEINTLASMTDAELSKYVSLWGEKMSQSKQAATSQLEDLRKQTDKKVKALQKTLTPLGLALEPMKANWASAFKPMVELFGQIMTPVVEFIGKIGGMITKFNEAHPVLAKVIQGFLMLLPILTLILAPLAIGIGLFGGLQAAFASVWMIIGPFVTGMATVMGTVLLVAAAIAVVGVALWALWTKTSWFKDAVITTWNAIKDAAIVAWNFLYDNVIKPVVEAVVSFVSEQLEKVRKFWDENGQNIMKIVKFAFDLIKSHIQNAMNIITGIFQIAWPIISGVVQIAWGIIKNIISTGIDIILGIIKFFSQVFTGDWRGAFDTAKQIATDIWHGITGIFEGIDLESIGKDIINGLIKGLGSMFGAVKKKVAELAKLVPAGVKSLLNIHSPSRVMMELGGYTGEGFADGIIGQIKSVSNATKSLSNTAVKGIGSDQVSNGQELQSGGVYEFNLSIPIDGRELVRRTIRFTSEELERMNIRSRGGLVT